MAETVQMPLVGAMLTDVGLVREANEDSVAYVATRAPIGGLAIVADGMGGHSAGEVASRLAVETILDRFHEAMDAGEPMPETLAASLAAANETILERSQTDPNCAGMGTTCTIVAIRDNHAFLAHIGDSRAYLWRDGVLHQISEDHSLVAALVRSGTITAADAETRTDRNVILQALGTKPDITPQIWREGLPLVAGDVLLLCSDGLSDLVDDRTIERTIGQTAPFDTCRALIDAANAAGGHDNISVGVIAIAPVLATEPVDRARVTRPMELPDITPRTPELES
jgi:serine/threonine protein phosphatase PrpC